MNGFVIFISAGLLVQFTIFAVIYASRYTKAGPNEVLVISGRRLRVQDSSGRFHTVGFRILKGGGTFVWPILEKCERLSLEPPQRSLRCSLQFYRVPMSVG